MTQCRGSIFTSAAALPGFDVLNPMGRTFALIQIDDKLLPQQPGGQCDCAFVYDGSFNLLEFKTNAMSFNKRTVRNTYRKATDQLKNTIGRFLSAGVDVRMLAGDAEAHICFNNTYPRKKASEMSRSMRFAMNTGGVGLFFESSKSL